MAALTDLDIEHIRSIYPYLTIDPLTKQEETLLAHYLASGDVANSAEMAGYSTKQARRLLEKDSFKAILRYLREEQLGGISVTRDRLTMMLFEAHRKSATATEEIAAIRELGKLHGFYDGPPPQQVTNITVIQQLESLPEEKLLEMAGRADSLEPALIEHDDWVSDDG